MARKNPGKPAGEVQEKSSALAMDAETLYRTFIDAIVDQRLLPGTRLNELAMSKLFGVSRREMEHLLMRLECEGLAVSILNRGSFVASPDAQEARAIFGARKSIEAGIVELAATRASGADFKILEKSIADEEALRNAGRMREAIKESGRFHLLLADIAGNVILADLVKQLVARTSLVTSLYDNASGMSCWHDDHGKLIGHLKARRTKRAIDIMRQHLDDLEASLDLSVKIGLKADLRTIFGLPVPPSRG